MTHRRRYLTDRVPGLTARPGALKSLQRRAVAADLPLAEYMRRLLGITQADLDSEALEALDEETPQ